MKIAIGSDHGGYALKMELIPVIEKLGFEVTDFGCPDEKSVDYPDIAFPVAEAVAETPAESADDEDISLPEDTAAELCEDDEPETTQTVYPFLKPGEVKTAGILMTLQTERLMIRLYEKNGFVRAGGVYREVIDERLTLCEYGYELRT